MNETRLKQFTILVYLNPSHLLPVVGGLRARLAVVAQLGFAQLIIQSVISSLANTPTCPLHSLSFEKEFGVAICTSARELL